MSLSLAQFIILGVAAFAMSGLMTAPVRILAIRIGAMDAPNLERKTQTAPVPYLGGVSIALTVSIITYAAVIASDSTTTTFPLASYVLIPALFMALMGLVDDLKGLPPLPRLAMQTLAGVAVSLVLVSTDTMGVAFNNPVLDIGISILWIVGICNSINFFDNIDGGAAGTVVVATLGIAFIAYSREQELVAALAIVTGGATLGFLLWNKAPAKIYMGDAGALFLGVLLSVLTIRLNPGITPNWKSLAIPPILLAVPILDTCIAVFSRIKRGISPFQGGKDHLSHRLVRKGLQRKSAAVSLWGLGAIFGCLAVAIYTWPQTAGTQLIIGTLILWIALFIWFWSIPSED
jgi:UDP-GlcNAc:undecaprenyl-phosphate/decaprenyl-phosphate GlcNAc-1-phosphate transferase